MNRRNFLGLGMGAAAVAVIPSTLSAVDYRKTAPKVWDAAKVESGMEQVFGTSSTVEGKVKLKAPEIAENGAVVPVTVTSKLEGSRVAIFQDANPESVVAVFTVPKGGIINYQVRIKLAKSGNVTAVVEADGKLYSASKQVKVTAGGCGG